VGAARRLLAISDDDPAARDFALRVIADVDPFDASAHGQLGRRLLESSEFQPALVEFEVALALGPPNLAEAHSDIADALLRLGRRDDAKQAALRALMEAPTFARAQDLLLQAIGRW
jgi:Flp pilus assembly protein TadD